MALELRAVAEGDAETALAVVIARDIADLGVPDFSLEDVRADWATEGCEAWLTTDGQGYAFLHADGDGLVLVHPQAEGAGRGTLLREHLERRARERGIERVMQFVAGANDRAREHLEAAGYVSTQRFSRLRRPLDGRIEPPGRELRTFRPGADDEVVWRVIADAFAEVPGDVPTSLGRWRAKHLAKPSFDPGRCFVAEDAEGVCGAVMSEPFETGAAYVSELGVARRARGRGVGRALLLAAFAAAQERGDHSLELSVNAQNPSALRLYESVGMTVAWRAERWEKAL